MNSPIEETAAEFPDAIEDATRDAWETARKGAGCTIEQSKRYVRANPVPVVLGALAVGVVVGLLITRGSKPEPQLGALEGKINELKDFLGTLGGKVSTVANDQYDGLSTSLGDALKKAKKRLHFS